MKRKAYRQVRIICAAVFFFMTLFCVFSGNERAAKMMSYHLGPLFVSMASTLAISGILIILGILGTTILFGRYYCAVVCPLGILQDTIGSLKKSGDARVPNIRASRYSTAMLAFLLLCSGWAVGFKFFDPFSRFGGIASAVFMTFSGSLPRESEFTATAIFFGGLLPLILLAVLVFWKRRIYCTTFCPVGTVLGLCAKYGIYRMNINDACNGCQFCERSCPTSCIDSQARRIDNERCVRCMNCISRCPNNALTFSRQQVRHPETDLSFCASRRAFLSRSITLSVGVLLAGHALAGPIQALSRFGERRKGIVFPPGAIDSERFTGTCMSCQLCAVNCPAKIIKPSAYALDPVHLDYTDAGCQYDCARCASVCPSGALRHLTLEDKQWLKIGEAIFDAPKCRVVKDETACDLCAKACPKGAVRLFESSSGFMIPEVAVFHCIGCGACQAACPQSPKAIYVEGVEQQNDGY